MSQTSRPTKDVRGVTLCQDPAREACFVVVHTDAEMEDWPGMSEQSRREKLHRHMNNEVGALEIVAQCLVDFADAPWALRMQLARQASDESRHVLLLYRRLREIGGRKGEFPVANFEWGVTCMIDNLPGRLAVQNRTFEAGLIDLLGVLRTRWREAGDDTTADVLDGILADEIAHVRFANRWIRRMTEENPQVLLQVARAVRYLREVNGRLAPAMGDTNAVGIAVTEERVRPPAVNVNDRLAAEFTQEEVLEVLRQAGFRSIVPRSTEERPS